MSLLKQCDICPTRDDILYICGVCEKECCYKCIRLRPKKQCDICTKKENSTTCSFDGCSVILIKDRSKCWDCELFYCTNHIWNRHPPRCNNCAKPYLKGIDLSEKEEIPTGYLYNTCYGGFGLSKECIALYKARTGKKPEVYLKDRKDPVLIKIFLEKGSYWTSDNYSDIKFLEVPHELLQYIRYSEYDGVETVGVSYTAALNKLTAKFLESVLNDESNLIVEYRKLKKELEDVKELCDKMKEKRGKSVV